MCCVWVCVWVCVSVCTGVFVRLINSETVKPDNLKPDVQFRGSVGSFWIRKTHIKR